MPKRKGFKNITAYNIQGVFYFRKGKFNGKKKKKIIEEISHGGAIQWEDSQKDSPIKSRRKAPQTSRGNRFKHVQNQKEKIGDLLSWLQI